jgi:hypothetical protein
MRGYTRDELIALTPHKYLAGGYLDDAGQERSELVSDYATAAATQLLAAECPAQELAFTYEAVRSAPPDHEGDPRARARAAVDEALATVSQMTRQTNNEGLVRWLDECVTAIRRPADVDAFLRHMGAVLRLCVMIASIPEPEQSDGSLEASSPDLPSP